MKIKPIGNMKIPSIRLNKTRSSTVKYFQHPWVFSNGLQERPLLEPGTVVRVMGTENDEHVGYGFYHPKNNIALRMFAFGNGQVDAAGSDSFWKHRIAKAHRWRKQVLPQHKRNYRLIHGENDGFPGLTVDCFDEKLLVMQVTSAGFDNMKNKLAEWLRDEIGCEAVYENSTTQARKQEGLKPDTGFIFGEIELPVRIEELGFKAHIDPRNDQKNGFFLDHYPARLWLQQNVKDKTVLDLFSNTGGFTLPALQGGARKVVSVDSSQACLDKLEEAIKENQLPGERQESLREDIFGWLTTPTPSEQYDLVILDPPSLCKSLKSLKQAEKGIRHLNRWATQWVKPGGLLLSFDCTGAVSQDCFQRNVFLGLRHAEKNGLVLQRFGPGPDHPESIAFPEGSYLKGLLCMIDNEK